MKKRFKIYFAICTIFTLLILIWSYFLRWPYYGGWENIIEDTWINIKNLYINTSPERMFVRQQIVVDSLIKTDYSKSNDYRTILTSQEDFINIAEKKYYVKFYKWFMPLNISKDCYIYEANADELEKTVWADLSKYKKQHHSLNKECGTDCKIYLTEKWLLKSNDIYSCE